MERSLGAAWNAEIYLENENAARGLCFAGCLLYYLIKNHCFVDGDKRVGWAASMEVLRSLGLTVDASQEEAEALCLAVIDSESDLARDAISVSHWLAPRLIAIS